MKNKSFVSCFISHHQNCITKTSNKVSKTMSSLSRKRTKVSIALQMNGQHNQFSSIMQVQILRSIVNKWKLVRQRCLFATRVQAQPKQSQVQQSRISCQEHYLNQCSPLMRGILQGVKPVSKKSPQPQKIHIPVVPDQKEGEPKVNSNNHSLQYFRPMLSGPLANEAEFDKFCDKKKCPIVADVKYDGQRTTISYNRDHGLQMTSRNNKSQNIYYKRLYEKIHTQLMETDLQSIQLDGEIMALDRETLGPLSFTELQKTRKSKANFYEEEEDEDPNKLIVVYIFDVTEHNGQNLLQQPLIERRKLIPVLPIFMPLQSKTFHFPQERAFIIDYFKDVLTRNYEGLILKGTKDLYYTNESRVHWKKLKKGSQINREDKSIAKVELDVVLMGANKGKNIRNSTTLTSFLLGVPYQGKIVPISNVGSGFSQENAERLHQIIEENELIVKEVPPEYQLGPVKVDIYFRPELVVEVHATEIIPSPIYNLDRGGAGGLSLRFPAFKRIREDKGVTEATTGEEFIEMSKNFNLPK